jgi:hypothetical protein
LKEVGGVGQSIARLPAGESVQSRNW